MPSALVDVNELTVGAVVSEYVSVAFALASELPAFNAWSRTNPASTTTRSALSDASPVAPKPAEASRLAFFADVNVRVSVVEFVTTAVSMSDLANVTSDNAGDALLL